LGKTLHYTKGYFVHNVKFGCCYYKQTALSLRKAHLAVFSYLLVHLNVWGQAIVVFACLSSQQGCCSLPPQPRPSLFFGVRLIAFLFHFPQSLLILIFFKKKNHKES
jgi:hypothetical protein